MLRSSKEEERQGEREGEGERTTCVKERKKESVSWGGRIQSGF